MCGCEHKIKKRSRVGLISGFLGGASILVIPGLLFLPGIGVFSYLALLALYILLVFLIDRWGSYWVAK